MTVPVGISAFLNMIKWGRKVLELFEPLGLLEILQLDHEHLEILII